METKKSIGKLYEKFEMIKNFTHQLEIAVAQNDLTGQEEFIIVWCDPNDEDRKMPLAQLLTGTEIQEYLEPDFTKSYVASELEWKEELGKNDPFGFSKAINFDVLQDKEKFNKIVKILDKMN